MVRNANNVSICIWYEMAMVRNGYGTKMIFTMVQNGRYEMVMVRNDYNSMEFTFWVYFTHIKRFRSYIFETEKKCTLKQNLYSGKKLSLYDQ
jgi:hypothetical protein